MTDAAEPRRITHAEMLKLKRWNTPTIYNGWEQITSRDSARECFNREEVRDFMPQMGVMVGRAVTVVVQASDARHRKEHPENWTNYVRYVASVPAPKIVVVQDLDKPDCHGALWGEVCANTHRALGCVGTITDGPIRDVDEMANAGLKAIARRLCIGHGHIWPLRWNCDVEVFGTRISPGQLIHADKHGFLAIPAQDEAGLLDAAVFMDNNECNTVIPAARGTVGLTTEEALRRIAEASAAHGKATRERFRAKGAW